MTNLNASTSNNEGLAKVNNMVNNMKYKPSKYQIDVFIQFITTMFNLVINAVAGSGKTTTIIQLLDLIDKSKRVLFLAFNVEIKKELGNKVADKGYSNVNVSTSHSFGYRQLTNYYGKNKIRDIDSNKYIKLLRKCISYALTNDVNNVSEYYFTNDILKFIRNNFILTDNNNNSQYQSRVVKLASLARLNLVDDIQTLENLAWTNDVEICNGECAMALALVNVGKNYIRFIDYTDMIYLPLANNIPIEKYDYVIVDECQDLNSAQRELMLKAVVNGRFIAVGDRKQAIYAFAGADAASFEKLVNTPNTIELPLSVCYRCGSDIIELAKQFVPTIEAHENNGKGTVNENSSLADIKAGDLVLCRNTYPLVKLAFNYLKTGVKALIKGQDVGKNLISLVTNTKQNNAKDIIETLNNEKTILLSNISRKKNITVLEAEDDLTYIAFCDKVQVITLFAENSINADDIIGQIERLFSDDKTNGIQLSTIHKAKGLEANNVFIIHRDLMPAKQAKNDWQIEQEKNLIYVAYTRAKNTLGFITDFNAYDVNEKKFVSNAKIIVPQFVGTPNEKISLTVTVDEIKNIQTQNFGYATVYRLTDRYGNIWSKWGNIGNGFIVNNDSEIKTGTQLQFTALIKEHKMFRGEKINVIKTISQYNPKLDISLFVE